MSKKKKRMSKSNVEEMRIQEYIKRCRLGRGKRAVAVGFWGTAIQTEKQREIEETEKEG